MLRAYKYRIYPSEEQRIFFAKTFGCVRFVYNKMLYDRQLAHQEFQEHGVKQKPKRPAFYKAEYPFLKEVAASATTNIQKLKTSRFVIRAALFMAPIMTET
ncbi:helix-turn-helix domain-containing protein [Paenibacillus sp. Soil522]|uniref:helix-turn-helix domain-containing protein n=1 Tax=Paenibacillus sp. Soil522 TaxID=1736388 RepID=UPI0006FA475A|nr:helix-turn-helix domain-containing protein [Paenibacillus sp. Soil522]KRE40521.1 hypothetical protein ASG81_17170 [Paenibacillus sp. Soil522]